ncbi:hypothetical protein [Actibacterium sp.]|uniref:hypothetical protein n=1 Tax=Actibacterium sp. TaxID=1872125 RepID=UPI00356880D6
MASFDNGYSRFIAWAKVILPLAALGLLSTLFLFSRTLDPTAAIPFAKVDVQQLIREQRITAPNYAGVTEDGTAISLSAATVKPDAESRKGATAADVAARLEFASGASADIRADLGTVDANAGLATLSGNVVLDSSTGYHINANSLTAALDRTDIQAQGPITATGPAGTLSAGMLHITTSDTANAEDSYVLVFKQGVELIYQPSN